MSKCVKALSKEINLRFLEGITMRKVVDTANWVLVWDVRGRTYLTERFRLWTFEICGTLLKEITSITILSWGWFALSFHQEDYTDWILSRYWHIEMAPMLLKWWSALFNKEQEQLGASPIWVCLPWLPLYFWSEDIFIHIDNELGT